jgi:uncharacterized protein (DUF1501 family)
MTILKRRQFIQTGALALGGAFITSRLAFARADAGQSRFVFILMRGALDGLAAVPPYGDPDYAGLRRELALKAPGMTGGALPLDGLFGLHPSFTFLRESYVARELIVFHATASPYRERSHFDGQDVLENGFAQPHAVQTGWLNRALSSAQVGQSKEAGVALGQNIPLVMRGPAAVTSWSPSKLPALEEDTLQRIADLYAGDPVLASRLADALNADAIADAREPVDALPAVGPGASGGGGESGSPGASGDPSASGGAGVSGSGGMRTSSGARVSKQSMLAGSDGGGVAEGSAAGDSPRPDLATNDASTTQAKESIVQRAKPMRYTELVRATAGFLRRDDGPHVAVFDTTGWDTHANEGSAEGQLAARLAALDAGLRTLKHELGPVWSNTAVVLATEFGRTAATNGTRGTDHGTATVAFLLGGAVQGGRVVADWPGLASRALYQGRDLRPTTDLRSVLKGVLADHMRVPSSALEGSVFPDSAGARPMGGLFKA